MLARAQKMTPIAAVQNRYNLLDRSGVQVLASYDELTGLADESTAALGQPPRPRTSAR